MIASTIKKKSLSEQAAVLAAGNAFALLISLIVPMVLVRVFAQEEYGLYQQLFLIFTTVLPLGQMSVTQGLYYFLPREPEKRNAVVGQTLFFVLAGGFVCFIILLLFRSQIAVFMNNPEIARYLSVVVFFIFFMIVASFLETLMIAEGRVHLSSLIRVVSEFFRSLAIITTALVTKKLLDIFIVLTIFSAARCVLLWLYIKGRYCLFSGAIDFRFWRCQLTYSIPIGLANVAWLVQTRLHNFFVTFLFPPATYAIYAIGTYNLPLLGIVTTAVSNVMMPTLARYQKDGNIYGVFYVWVASLRKMNLFFFPLFVFFFITAREFITVLFTEKYVESVGIFRISLVVILVSGFNTGAILNAYAETSYQMKIALIRLPIAFAVLYFFTKAWGIYGAVTANVLVSVFFRLLVLGRVSKVLDVSLVELLRLQENGKIMLVSLIAGLPVLVLMHFVFCTPIIMLGSCALLFCITYCLTGIWMEIITRSEISEFRIGVVKKLFFCRRRS